MVHQRHARGRCSTAFEHLLAKGRHHQRGKASPAHVVAEELMAHSVGQMKCK